jgi:hypothetical protein
MGHRRASMPVAASYRIQPAHRHLAAVLWRLRGMHCHVGSTRCPRSSGRPASTSGWRVDLVTPPASRADIGYP